MSLRFGIVRNPSSRTARAMCAAATLRTASVRVPCPGNTRWEPPRPAPGNPADCTNMQIGKQLEKLPQRGLPGWLPGAAGQPENRQSKIENSKRNATEILLLSPISCLLSPIYSGESPDTRIAQKGLPAVGGMAKMSYMRTGWASQVVFNKEVMDVRSVAWDK
jgi:hypothetical protein